ncbi:6-bladed beta-propeller [Membranihabitans maritimus]|uniref:6-bladed beta-propeller n=1 Tax=Membranihabitans maritimus TaxID=2904244 RepID=UPI001F1765F4|nr:6-bladed beta-propeller [Membranihabitans maritimus]
MKISIEVPEISESEKMTPSTFFQPSQTIVLKMNPKMPLQSIGKFEKFNNHWIVLDAVQNYIFRYDSSGIMVNRIGAIGNGPGEYLEITDFSAQNDEIVIYSNSSRKIIHYNLKGKVTKELSVPFFANQIEILDSFYILNTGTSNPDVPFDILCLDRAGKVLDSFHNNSQITLQLDFSSSGFLHKNMEDQIRFLPTFGNTVYNLNSETKFKPYLTIDLGPNEIDFTKFESMDKFLNSYFKYTWLSNRYFENKAMLLFYYMEDKRIKYAIHKKGEYKIYTRDQIKEVDQFKPISVLKSGYIDDQYFYSTYFIRPEDYQWIYTTIDWPQEVNSDTEKKSFIEKADAIIFKYKIL